MIKHHDSHIDHHLTEAQLRYLLDRFADRNAFFLETIELPETIALPEHDCDTAISHDVKIISPPYRAARGARSCVQLGTVPCGLWGPIMGDPPIDEAEVQHAPRGNRAWTSRLVDRPARQTRAVTVIAGPHEEKCPRCGGSGECISLDIQSPQPTKSPYGSNPMTYACSDCAGTGTKRHACILYTAFGGPAAPQEPGDPGCKDPAASAAFWQEHALAK